MQKPYRFLLYFLIGVGLYFMIGADKDPKRLDGFHEHAPMLIGGIFVLILIGRYFASKKNKDQ